MADKANELRLLNDLLQQQRSLHSAAINQLKQKVSISIVLFTHYMHEYQHVPSLYG
jgi:hypothetical protein